MVDERAVMVVERGLLSVPEEMWALAVRRAEGVGSPGALSWGLGPRMQPPQSCGSPGVRCTAARAVAGRRRCGVGPAAGPLRRRPGRRASAGQGRGIVRGVVQPVSDPAAPSVAAHREIARECRTRGLRVPSRGTVVAADRATGPCGVEPLGRARCGPPAAVGRGVPPAVTGLLEQVQIDHTPVDVIVVDERHRYRSAARMSRRRSMCAAAVWWAWW